MEQLVAQGLVINEADGQGSKALNTWNRTQSSATVFLMSSRVSWTVCVGWIWEFIVAWITGGNNIYLTPALNVVNAVKDLTSSLVMWFLSGNLRPGSPSALDLPQGPSEVRNQTLTIQKSGSIEIWQLLLLQDQEERVSDFFLLCCLNPF